VRADWQKIIHRKYPVLDNPHDPQTRFLEEIVDKNSFGEEIKYSSAVVDPSSQIYTDIIVSYYDYDPSFNRISQSIKDTKGLQHIRLILWHLIDGFTGSIRLRQ
jgi:hypothetical protein